LVIETYLQRGVKLPGFHVYKARALEVDVERLEGELELLRRFLERLMEEGGG